MEQHFSALDINMYMLSGLECYLNIAIMRYE